MTNTARSSPIPVPGQQQANTPKPTHHHNESEHSVHLNQAPNNNNPLPARRPSTSITMPSATGTPLSPSTAAISHNNNPIEGSSGESLGTRLNEAVGMMGTVRILSTSCQVAQATSSTLQPQQQNLSGRTQIQTAGTAAIPATSAPGSSTTSATTAVPAPTPISAILHDDPKRRKSEAKSVMIVRPSASKKVTLFAHLPQYEKVTTAVLSERVKDVVHPAVVRLGLYFVNKPLMGAVERCELMLEAFKQVIRDYTPPSDQVISRHLESYLKPIIAYLVQARPLSVSQSNAIRYLKLIISRLDPDLPLDKARKTLIETVDRYIEQRITAAVKSIASKAADKICDGDVIMTYARATSTIEALKEAALQGKQFRVIVAGSRPFTEGRDTTMPALSALSIPCTYCHINAVGYVIHEVTKVIIGAYCIFSNGAVMSRAGCSIIAQQGHVRNIPVLVLCETVKFSERVQLDSFVFNELADPDDLLKNTTKAPCPFEHDQSLNATQVQIVSKQATQQTKKSNQPLHPNTAPTTPTIIPATVPNNINKPLSATPWYSPVQHWRSLPSLKLLSIFYDVTPAQFITVVVCELGLIPPTSIPVVLRELNNAFSN